MDSRPVVVVSVPKRRGCQAALGEEAAPYLAGAPVAEAGYRVDVACGAVC